MKISPNTLTLKQFFSVANEQFVIPAYQRRYAWGAKEQRDLFNDIRLLPAGDTHLLGTVLLLSEAYTPILNQLELVDGQQRITTISILMIVLAEQLESKNLGKKAADLRKLLECERGDSEELPKIKLGDLDDPEYQRVMVNTRDDECENPQLVGARENFTNWFEVFSAQDLVVFQSKLLNSAALIRLDVSAAKDAYKLFETINNRGLRLKPTDIIKNFLLGHASSLPKETLEKVKNDWRQLIVALDGLDSDDFFRQWLAGKLHRKVTNGKVVVDFRSYYFRHVTEAETMTEFLSSNLRTDDEDDDFEDVAVLDEDNTEIAPKTKKVKLVSFAKDLRKASELYAKLLKADMTSKKVNRHMENLRRIKAFQAFTWLLDMFDRNCLDEKTHIRLLRALEAFMMRRHICEKRANELETIFSGLTGIDDEGYEATVLDTLREHTPPDREFESSFADFPFVAAVIDRARYALEMFEYEAITHKNEYYLATPDELQLEHIIPQAAEKSITKAALGDWPTYLGGDWKSKHAKNLHRIGNMTLLANKLNVKASNNPFLAKRVEYDQSNIKLTKNLVAYSQFKFKAVDDRSKALAKLAVQIWKV